MTDRETVAYLRSLLAEREAEFRAGVRVLLDAWAISMAVRDYARVERLRAARGPIDVEAERVILSAAGRGKDMPAGLPRGVRPDHFGEPLHADIARAIDLMRLAALTRSPSRRAAAGRDLDELQLFYLPESRGYMAGLLAAPPPTEDGLSLAVEIVVHLAVRRRVLALAQEAVSLLERDGADIPVCALQKALDIAQAAAPRRAARRAA